MDRIIQENSNLVDQNSKTSQHMVEEAIKLQSQLNMFRVDKISMINNLKAVVKSHEKEIDFENREQIPENTEAVKEIHQ